MQALPPGNRDANATCQAGNLPQANLHTVRNQPCAWLLLGVSAGIVLDRYFPIPLTFSWIAAGVLALATLLGLMIRLGPREQLGSWLLFLGWLAAGATWHHCYYRTCDVHELGRLASDEPRPIQLRGWVVERPQTDPAEAPGPFDRGPKTGRTRLVVQATEIRDGLQWKPVSGKTTVTVDGRLPRALVGDEIIIGGQFSRPPVARCPGDFDLREHYRAQRIHCLLFVDCPDNLQLTGRVLARLTLGRILNRIADQCGRTIDRNFPPESAALVRAMLLGEKQWVPSELQDRFLVSGTMHLLAISGLHVGILSAGWLLLIRLGLVSRNLGYGLTIGFVLVYCLVTGARPPVMRATILVILFCLARISGRNPISVNSLCLAGVIVLMSSPAALFQPGPQLSFTAVATLIMLARYRGASRTHDDPLLRFIRRKRNRWARIRDHVQGYLRVLVISSLGIWIATLPLVAEYFHVISWVGVPLNVLLMLPLAVLLNGCFLTVLLGGVGVGEPLSGLTDHLLQGIIRLIEIASELPGGHWWTYGVGPIWLSIFYLFFAIFFLDIRPRIGPRRQLGLALIWFTLAISTIEIRRATNHCGRATFIDVGHGTSVLIEFPGGKSLLYDAGCLSSSNVAVQRISAVLWHRKISRIDTVVISHADLDHFNAVPGLLRRFAVDRVLISPQMQSKPAGAAVKFLHQSLARHQVPITAVHADQEIRLDSRSAVRILHPTVDFSGTSDNADSLVLLIELDGGTLLLPGDLEYDGLDKLLRREPIPVDVLMAPHHGSRCTDHGAMAHWGSPRHVVVSCTARNWTTAVESCYRDPGGTVHVTGLCGTISVQWEKGRPRVAHFLQADLDR